MVATKDQVAQLVVAEAKARNHTRDECLAEMACLYQESQWNDTVWGPEGKQITYGVAQQDGSYPNRFEGAAAQVKAFFDRLDVKRNSPAHGDIWANLFWIQQGPNWPSAQYGLEHGRIGYLSEIKSRIGTVTPYLNKYWPNDSGDAPVALLSGDPVWIEDVLRPALGDRLKTFPGWQDRGHGDFSTLWGIVWHHTGNSNEKPDTIANHPTLGLASNLHIAKDGTVTITGVGVAWHAGQGSYPGLPTNDANQHTIGIECAWPDIRPDGSYDPGQRWPDAQIIAMRDVGAALTAKLGVDVSHNIGHKEWAGASQGKWDPGNLDMNWFRGEIAKDMRGEFDPKPSVPPTPQPAPVLPPDYAKESWDQLRIAWPQLGHRTLVDAVAELLRRTEPKDA